MTFDATLDQDSILIWIQLGQGDKISHEFKQRDLIYSYPVKWKRRSKFVCGTRTQWINLTFATILGQFFMPVLGWLLVTLSTFDTNDLIWIQFEQTGLYLHYFVALETDWFWVWIQAGSESWIGLSSTLGWVHWYRLDLNTVFDLGLTWILDTQGAFRNLSYPWLSTNSLTPDTGVCRFFF